MSLHFRKINIVAAWAAIFLAGATVGWLGARARALDTLAQLATDVRRCAIAFEPAEMRQLTGTRADLDSPVYAAVKNRLRTLQTATPQMRFASIVRFTSETNHVIFLVDVAQADTRPESLPGDVHSGAAQRPGLQRTLRTGFPATEGPVTDHLGPRVTAYAPIGVATGEAAKGTREILGIDMDASNWTRELWFAGLRRAFFIWILLGLPLGAWLALRRQSEQREVIRNLSEAMEQSHSALLILDLESRIEYANRGLCQQIGYTRRELIGHRWRDFQATETSELTDLSATVRTGKPWEGEWLNRRKDGTIYPVRGVVTPVKQRDGSLSCFVAVFEDVTEVKRREAELREARDLAEAGDRAKSQFLATMSHEVRTPLNGIVGFTSLLLDTTLEAEQREYVQTIRASGEALIQLTGDILDFARIESGRLKLDPSACDPRDSIEEALDLHAAKAAEKNIELLHRVDDGVPAAIVIDGGRLRQVLVNLIGNAVKFTESGEVQVTVAMARDSRKPLPTPVVLPGGSNSPYVQPDVCTLVFSVRDTGIGIAPNQHAKLFKPFTQLDESSTRRYSGTGLGLAICRNLVHVLGGEISVTSEPGQGSTFTFTVRAPVASVAAPPRELDGLQLGLVAEPGSLRRELVLLARSWRMIVHEANAPEDLAGRPWDVALVDLSDTAARALAQQTNPHPSLRPDKTFGLVPITLSSDVRTKLRSHFRLLVNKPVHHESLFSVFSGANPRDPLNNPPPTQLGLRVLVVEDNAVNQRLMQRVLVNLGCTWMIVENGRLALEELAARAAEYDVILLDLHMPEMDGLTALQEIRRGTAGAHARTMWIIALTADARDEQRSRAQAAGVNDYLTKPLKVAELEIALQRYRAERGPKRAQA